MCFQQYISAIQWNVSIALCHEQSFQTSTNIFGVDNKRSALFSHSSWIGLVNFERVSLVRDFNSG